MVLIMQGVIFYDQNQSSFVLLSPVLSLDLKNATSFKIKSMKFWRNNINPLSMLRSSFAITYTDRIFYGIIIYHNRRFVNNLFKKS